MGQPFKYRISPSGCHQWPGKVHLAFHSPSLPVELASQDGDDSQPGAHTPQRATGRWLGSVYMNPLKLHAIMHVSYLSLCMSVWRKGQ